LPGIALVCGTKREQGEHEKHVNYRKLRVVRAQSSRLCADT
jgi:hypothetical protein